jgi:hypothetical protein
MYILNILGMVVGSNVGNLQKQSIGWELDLKMSILALVYILYFMLLSFVCINVVAFIIFVITLV